MIDLPEPSALPVVARGFRMVRRLVRHNPFCHAWIYASGFGGALNIRANIQWPPPSERHLQSSGGGNRAPRNPILGRMRERRPNNG